MGFKISQTVIGYTDSNVNLKNTGSTLIFTNSSSSSLYFPYKVRIYATNLTGLSVAPIFSIGMNASSYNNLLASSTPSTLLNGTFIDYLIISPGLTIPTDGNVFINVTNAATATNYGVRIAVYMDTF